MHIDSVQNTVQSDKKDNPKCQNVTLGEFAILNAIKNNPKITQEELAQKIGRTKRTAIRNTNEMQSKGLIRRKDGKTNGEWEVLVEIS